MSEQQKFIYRRENYDEEEAEYDAADYPHTYVGQDGTPLILVADIGDENLAKLSEFIRNLTYTHG